MRQSVPAGGAEVPRVCVTCGQAIPTTETAYMMASSVPADLLGGSRTAWAGPWCEGCAGKVAGAREVEAA